MSWTVVEFTETKTVEAVPTAWLHDNNCYWPPMSRSRIINEIKNGSLPNTHWPMYSIRIFKDGTYEEYMTARNKAKKAEDTSDLNSDYEPQKRKKIKRKIFDTESSESECETSSGLLPTPPKIILNSFMQKNKLMPNNGLRGNENSKALASLEKAYMPTSTGLEKRSVQNELCFKTPVTVTHQGNASAKQLSRQEEYPNLNCGCKELQRKLDDFMINMSKKMSSFKANFYQIREDLLTLKNQKQEPNKENTDHNFFQSFEFPLTNYEDLVRVNEYLRDGDHFKQAEHQMTKLGGKDSYDFIRRCFQHTMSDSLAMNYTLDGTKNKQPFKSLKLGALIMAASQHYGSDNKASEEAIRKWLRRATERNKYKK